MSKIVRSPLELTVHNDTFVQLCKNRRKMLEVQVRDTGVGISHQDQKKLFKLYGFLETTKEINTKGIGLGLHISKMIAQQFDGSIICISELGKGSNFVFLFALDDRENRDERSLRNLNPNPLCSAYKKLKVEGAK